MCSVTMAHAVKNFNISSVTTQKFKMASTHSGESIVWDSFECTETESVKCKFQGPSWSIKEATTHTSASLERRAQDRIKGKEHIKCKAVIYFVFCQKASLM